MRRLLIRLALDLQFPPFVWAFQAYYGLAVRAVVRSVRRLSGVRAIYACGSLARGDVLHGLSDIDFKIFVDGTAASGARGAIQARFARLRRWFPVLGPPDEKGIYSLDDFASDYRHYPLVQHLFDGRFYSHRLLWGEDLLSRLPVRPWSALDQGLTFFWKLKDWTEKINLLAGTTRISRIQKHYLFYKACCDIGLMWLCSASPERALGSRDAVMDELSSRLDGEDAAWVRSLAAERRGRWRRFETHPDQNHLAFKRLLDACLPAIMDGAGAGESRQFVVDRPPAPAGHSPHLAALRALVPRSTVSVRSWAFVPRSPLDSSLTGRLVYAVTPPEPLALAQADALRAHYRSRMAADAVVIVRERPGWHYSIDSALVDHWLGTPTSDDLLGLHIRDDAEIALSPREESRIAGRLAGFRAQLAPALNSPDLARMDGRDFDSFFFTALRVLIVAYEFAAGRLWLHGEPGDSLDYLKMRWPSLGRFLDLMRVAHDWVRAERPFNERLRAKAVRLLAACVAAAEGDGGWAALGSVDALPDETRIGISLVIVTRNRPRELARCLPTLLAQRRHPDELIVIDSSSTDATKTLVDALPAPYPVRCIRPPHEGVAAARNAGVNAAAHEIIAFADDDVVMEPDWLEMLEYCFLRDERIGIAGGSIHHMECGREDAVARFMRVAEKL